MKKNLETFTEVQRWSQSGQQMWKILFQVWSRKKFYELVTQPDYSRNAPDDSPVEPVRFWLRIVILLQGQGGLAELAFQCGGVGIRQRSYLLNTHLNSMKESETSLTWQTDPTQRLFKSLLQQHKTI